MPFWVPRDFIVIPGMGISSRPSESADSITTGACTILGCDGGSYTIPWAAIYASLAARFPTYLPEVGGLPRIRGMFLILS